MSSRDTAAQFGLADIQDSRVTMYQSRADFKSKTGRDPAPYNPDLPTKHWALTTPTTSKNFQFLVAQIDEGVAKVIPMTVPTSYAQAVNIPSGEANAEPRYSTEWADLPIEPLRPEEYLAITFGGIIAVRNRSKFAAETSTGFEQQVLSDLADIKRKLGV